MFDVLDQAPPDAILGLNEQFKADPRPGKINLGVGVYKDAQNQTPVLESVKTAESRILETEKSKGYLAIPGSVEYGELVRALLFGHEHEILQANRAATAHTPGGTGALRVAADFLKRKFPGTSIWLSDPTWANHKAIFGAAGVATQSYPYYDHATKSLDFDAMTAALREAPAGDAVLLHGCCHNPSGKDPNAEQWAALAELLTERGLLPVFDFAYQGFGDGLTEDATGLRAFATPGREMLVCSSFSKNFGLYNERVGALTIVGADAGATERAFSHVKISIRANYSNPPAHGGAVVQTILADTELRAQWEAELAAMRGRINEMRSRFVETLAAKGVSQDFSFIAEQKGMFSFSGLNPDQVQRLRDEHAIYIVGSGRINVAGMTPENMGPLCDAIAAVL